MAKKIQLTNPRSDAQIRRDAATHGWVTVTSPETGKLMNVPPGSAYAGGSSKGLFSASVPTYSSGSGFDGLLSQITSITSANNAWSAQQAQKQMDFQSSEAEKLRAFNSAEALKSREWQQYMSDTSHQREVQDLQKAGLNPVLSATAGAPVTSGASAAQGGSPSGAMGDTDTSASSSLVSLLGSLLAAQTSLTNSALSAQTNMAVADKYTEVSRLAALLGFEGTKYSSDVSSAASKYHSDILRENQITQSATSLRVAQIGYQGSVDSASIHASAQQAVARIGAYVDLTNNQRSNLTSILNTSLTQSVAKYGHDVKSWTDKEIASANRDLQRDMQKAGFDFQFEYQKRQGELDLHLADVNLKGDIGRGLAQILSAGMFSGMVG